MKSSFNFIVIGSGLAGLNFALEAAKLGTVCIITKSNIKESASFYAQGGVAVVLDNIDSIDSHIQDTLVAGAGLCNEDIVNIVCKEIIPISQDLIQAGVSFTKSSSGSIHLGKEGGHSAHRILHANDQTGKVLTSYFIEQVSKNKNITILENTVVVDLIIQSTDSSKNKCYGVYILLQNGSVHPLTAQYTCLASGGNGHIYANTTNPLVATGDGISMAYLHGARIRDMEFIQFHPTVLFSQANPAFLLSEALRGFGAHIVNHNKERFMFQYHSLGELAPRDIVSCGITKELQKSGKECVYLSLQHKDSHEIQRSFPFIYKILLENFNFNLSLDLIPVVPAAHYSCGGIMVDEYAQSDILNLFAIGEVASTGLHGANRLASNSLAEALVFSVRAVNKIKENYNHNLVTINIPPLVFKSSSLVENPTQIIDKVQKSMQKYVGVIRSNDALLKIWKELSFLYQNVYNCNIPDPEFIKMKSIIVTSYIVVQSALLRKESRGGHQNIDYPQTLKEARATILYCD